MGGFLGVQLGRQVPVTWPLNGVKSKYRECVYWVGRKIRGTQILDHFSY